MIYCCEELEIRNVMWPIQSTQISLLSCDTSIIHFWTKEFFQEAGRRLNRDTELANALRGVNTTIIADCLDKNGSFLIEVSDGKISSHEALPYDSADFRFSTSYLEWVSIVKNESKIEAEVVKGHVKFKGSMPKMLLYLGKVARLESKILGTIRSMNLEY